MRARQDNVEGEGGFFRVKYIFGRHAMISQGFGMDGDSRGWCLWVFYGITS